MNRDYMKDTSVFDPGSMKTHTNILFQSNYHTIIADALSETNSMVYLGAARITSDNVRVDPDCSGARITFNCGWGTECDVFIRAKRDYRNGIVITEKYADGNVITHLLPTEFEGSISWSSTYRGLQDAMVAVDVYSAAIKVLARVLFTLGEFKMTGHINDNRPCEDCDPKGLNS